jgi:hypothetical protein
MVKRITFLIKALSWSNCMNFYILLTLFIIFFGLNGCIKTPEKESKENAPEDKNAPKGEPVEITPELRAYLEEHKRRQEKYQAKTPEEIKEEVEKLQLEKNLGPLFEKPKESYEKAKEKALAIEKAKAAEYASRAEKAPQNIVDIFADGIKRMSLEPGQDLVNKLQEILSNPTNTNILIENLRKQAGISRIITDEKLREIFKSNGQRELVGSQPTISRTMREVMGTMKDVVSLSDGIYFWVKNQSNSTAKEFMQLLIDAILTTDRTA